MSSVLSLLLVMITFAFSRSQSLASCSAEVAICYDDTDCTSCADLLQGLVESGSIDTDITSCPAFFAGICTAVDTDECDVNNIYLLDFARCIVEDQFGCSGFTTCADYTGVSVAPTATPTAAPIAAPTHAPTSGANDGVTASATTALLGTVAALVMV